MMLYGGIYGGFCGGFHGGFQANQIMKFHTLVPAVPRIVNGLKLAV